MSQIYSIEYSFFYEFPSVFQIVATSLKRFVYGSRAVFIAVYVTWKLGPETLSLSAEPANSIKKILLKK